MQGFLSYTRTDDQFWGGYITEFRKSLELGVHVATGNTGFRLFQDIDGIELGVQWREKLEQAIDASLVFVPMLTPLLLASEPCREEMRFFLEHERQLKRDDLILPVYFVECPALEKKDELAKDVLAQEVAKRQRTDWRKKAGLPLEQVRDSILELARAVGAAVGRAQQSAPQDLIAPAAAIAEAQRIRYLDAAHTAHIDQQARRPALQERIILWADDHPDNNQWERRALETYGMRFVLATSTEKAVAILRSGPFDAVVSDMGRPGDARAGLTLLRLVRGIHPGLPYFIYCGPQARRLSRQAKEAGAQGITNDPAELISMLLSALR